MRLTAPPRVTLLNVLRYAKIKVHKVGFDRRRRPPAAALIIRRRRRRVNYFIENHLRKYIA